jgi:hypothetical protein
MAYRYVGVVVAKINGFQLFAWCVLVLGVSGISAQTPEIQSGSYLHKHVKQAAEYQAAQDIIAPLPELHDAFIQATAWMFERIKPRAAERNQARALAKMVAASQEFSKLEKKQIQSVLRHTAASTWKTGHTIGVSAAALATVAALVAAWTFRKHGLGINIGDPFVGIDSLITPPVAPAAVIPVPGVGAASWVVADAVRAATIAAELTPVVVPVPVVPFTGVGVGAGSRSTASAGALSQSNTSAPLAGAGSGSSGATAPRAPQGYADRFEDTTERIKPSSLADACSHFVAFGRRGGQMTPDLLKTTNVQEDKFNSYPSTQLVLQILMARKDIASSVQALGIGVVNQQIYALFVCGDLLYMFAYGLNTENSNEYVVKEVNASDVFKTREHKNINVLVYTSNMRIIERLIDLSCSSADSSAGAGSSAQVRANAEELRAVGRELLYFPLGRFVWCLSEKAEEGKSALQKLDDSSRLLQKWSYNFDDYRVKEMSFILKQYSSINRTNLVGFGRITEGKSNNQSYYFFVYPEGAYILTPLKMKAVKNPIHEFAEKPSEGAYVILSWYTSDPAEIAQCFGHAATSR